MASGHTIAKGCCQSGRGLPHSKTLARFPMRGMVQRAHHKSEIGNHKSEIKISL